MRAGRIVLIVAFCGHSSYVENLDDEKKVLLLLEGPVGDEVCEFFLGEYGGFDRFAYRCAKKIKGNQGKRKLVFVTPYLFENYRKNNIENIIDRFDQVVYPPIEKVPPRYAIARRNLWIAEQADVVIAYITHEYGGAYTMYRHAQKKHKLVYNIAPYKID